MTTASTTTTTPSVEQVTEAIYHYTARSSAVDDTCVRMDLDHVLRATKRVLDYCEQCGQPLPPAGPVTWVSSVNGSEGVHGLYEPTGSYDQQHGCGAWNSPWEVERTLPDDTDDFDVESFVAGLLTRLNDEITQARTEHDERSRAACEQAATDVAAACSTAVADLAENELTTEDHDDLAEALSRATGRIVGTYESIPDNGEIMIYLDRNDVVAWTWSANGDGDTVEASIPLGT